MEYSSNRAELFKMQVLLLKIAKDEKRKHDKCGKCKKSLTIVHDGNKIDFISVK